MVNYNLKPCPICRGKVHLKEYNNDNYNYSVYYIRCNNCDLTFGRNIYKNADLKN